MVFKKVHKRSFLGGTAAHLLLQHPFEADSATRPSQAGFFIKDELSDYRFLVDTGAFRSILPPPGDINTINHPSSSDLVAANGTSIRTYGEQVNIRLSGQAYTWTFIIADVRHPLLGADFLSHYSLMVDVARNRLLNIDSFTSTPLYVLLLNCIYVNIFLQSPRRIILSIVYMYMFTAFIFHPCSFILSCASFTICLIGYLPKIVLYRQLFSGNALHASLIFQLC